MSPKSTYVEGFLVPVKPGRKEDYVRLARHIATIFLDHGATRAVESWNDKVDRGAVNDMYTAVMAQDGEDVVFSWIEWPDKATRDIGWEDAIADPRMGQSGESPYANARVIHGGFQVILDTAADQGETV
jgi:uncharacterized protein YbaA (DUF1428 family)